LKEYLRYLIKTTGEVFKNMPRIISLAKFEYELGSRDMFMGKLWKVISPLIQIGVYWLVFGIGIRQGSPVDGYPYEVWLICGITPWFFVNKGIMQGAGSIHRKATLLTKINAPTEIVPISNVFANFFDFIWSIALMLIIYFVKGCKISWAMINLIYYILFVICFLIAISLITSVLVMMARDFGKILEMLLRLLFFLSPIMWRPGKMMPEAFWVFDRFNPIGYVINGFRNSMLYDICFYEDMQSVVIFWGMILILYMIGIAFQRKLRNNILDCL